MKVCFPINSNKGLSSEVYAHFGSASSFIIVDTESSLFETVINGGSSHEHGVCSPIQVLNGTGIDSIIVGGIGAGAINKLNNMGIKVYKASSGTIEANIKLLQSNSIQELGVKNACSGHSNNDCDH